MSTLSERRYFKLTLAYDGSAYAGWQRQDGQPTIQGALESALSRIAGESVTAVASSRTDAGVHAMGQVASCGCRCRLTLDRLLLALNANLPTDIRVLQVQQAEAEFHPIRDARRKRYRYVIQDGRVADVFARQFSWFVPGTLDETAMAKAGRFLVGTHDFSGFQASGSPRRSSVRTVFGLTVARPQDEGHRFLWIEIEADGFLYHMARNITGSLVEVGQGRKPATWIAEVLHSRDRRTSGKTAPAQGLYLLRVDY